MRYALLGSMPFGPEIPANQVGIPENVCTMREYALSGVDCNSNSETTDAKLIHRQPNRRHNSDESRFQQDSYGVGIRIYIDNKSAECT